jgi:energy-coupling factor transporter ATP-binding protein EcfA2
LQLRNFKAWVDSGKIDLKPVTMLLGTNSSGKSTLIQSLLLLKQTAMSPDRTIHLNLGGDEVNDLFNFGDFDDVLNQYAEAPRSFSLDVALRRREAKSDINNIGLRCVYQKISSGSVALQEVEISTNGQIFRAARREKGAYSIYVDEEPQPRGKGRSYAPERSISFSAEALFMLGEDGDLLEDTSLEIRRELEGISYLGPLRRKPERDYSWNKSRPGDLGSDGKGAIDALLASSLMKGDDRDYILNGVSRWLSRMKLADKIEVRQQGRSNRYELIVHRGEVSCNLRDVGIGVSQILPVLVVSYFAKRGSVVILEEPEIHLHPLAQSTLAELFVEVGKERDLQFIVETHSEHLFRRMQTLIAKNPRNLEDVSMYFIEREDGKAKLRTLEVDEVGRLLNWPDGFFGDAIGETREQARIAIERMKDRKK